MRADREALLAAGGGAAASVVAGVACLAPFAAILLGVGGLGWLASYAWLRLPASALALGLVGYGWIRLRRARCDKPLPKVMLAAALVLLVGVNALELALPALGRADARAETSGVTVVLDVDGMVGPACPPILVGAASRVDGVLGVDASFEERRATVSYDPARTDVDRIVRAIADDSGFRATLRP